MARWYATLALRDAHYGTGLSLGGRRSRPMDRGSFFSRLWTCRSSPLSHLTSLLTLSSTGAATPYQARRVPPRTRSRKPASPRRDAFALFCPSPNLIYTQSTPCLGRPRSRRSFADSQVPGRRYSCFFLCCSILVLSFRLFFSGECVLVRPPAGAAGLEVVCMERKRGRRWCEGVWFVLLVDGSGCLGGEMWL